ncbi:DUF5995 family protein [Nocardioides bizhenqiangii]|uniref:DUF5995 family protein n=1 Tax=Nocardioides bizhenqiangii TaxID=3095076 RepID=A0ABZ0ZW81_9ACTN|nr:MULTISPECIES: DUF5995 family protein [unclassified Nocardioides]MDZ5621781.1 DUF5995 family protein [Nocardioides sp. HM23]WQQ27533.1 DUF5995 family protein [Nocardioides sp. HM61]
MSSLTRAFLAAFVALVLSAAPLVPASADDPAPPADPDPVRGLVLPPLDSVIGLLPPLPVPGADYAGDLCRSGSGACIDRVIARMKVRLDRLVRTCSHSAIFSLAYLRVTENVRDAVRSGYFDDAKWLNRVDTVFADLYFDVTSRWESGRRTNIPAAWKIALQAEDDRAVSGLGNFMLAMNAHINRDFPYVIARVGLTAPDGTSHKADHNRYNQRLDSLYAPVFAEEARRFDPTFDDVDAGTVEETIAGVIMRGWREMVWRHAELLALSRNPAQRTLAQREIETYAALQALVIRQLFQIPDSTRRDAWCAAHGQE